MCKISIGDAFYADKQKLVTKMEAVKLIFAFISFLGQQKGAMDIQENLLNRRQIGLDFS